MSEKEVLTEDMMQNLNDKVEFLFNSCDSMSQGAKSIDDNNDESNQSDQLQDAQTLVQERGIITRN